MFRVRDKHWEHCVHHTYRHRRAGLAGLTLAHYLHRHGIPVAAYDRDHGLSAREAGYRVHINSTGTSALHAALEPRLWELFLATCGMPDDDMLL